MKTDLQILMLEDELLDAELNKAQLLALEEYNCIVDWVTNKEAYLKAIESNTYDIVLSDYNLPQYTGLDALNDLRKLSILTPFIFVTGAINEETAANTIKAGAWDYVVKDRLIRLPLAIKGALKLREEKIISARAEQQNRKLLMATEQSPSHIIISDTHRIIEYVNIRFTEVTGYEPKEVIGKKIEDFFPEMKETLENLDVFFTNGKSWKGETISTKKDGTMFWENVLISPLRNENNEITHFITVKDDITQKKLMEQQLIEARDKAEQSEKLKDAFLKNLSHELRTPLNAIVGFSELISDETKQDPDTLKKYSDIIMSNSMQLLSIVNDVLTISSIEVGQEIINLKNVEVNEILDSLYDIYLPQTKIKNLNFRVVKASPNSKLYTKTDSTKLSQILSNLLNNSLKFTHKGSIELGYSLKDNEIWFFVKDTGIGIKKEAHQYIFERFRQADLSISVNYGGTGLGLSICQSYASMLDGKIWVESEQNYGSTFYISIPLISDVIKDQPLVDNTNYDIFEKPITILIAEDEINNYYLLQTLLENENIKLIHVTDGLQAVKSCRGNNSIDLVLMDIKMPVMDGIKALEQIRQFNKNLPVIAQTAYALEHEKQYFLEKGFNNYIAKPIKRADFFSILSHTLVH